MRKLSLSLLALLLGAALCSGPQTAQASFWVAVFSAGSASANGTCIGVIGPATCTPTQIKDNAAALWTLSSTGCPGTANCVFKNGAAAGFTASVVSVLWWNGVVYQENSTAQFYPSTGCTGAPSTCTWGSSQGDPRQSASGTTIPNAAQIYDASSNLWTLSSTGCPGAAPCVFENGAAAGYSVSVVTLLYYSGTIYQYNGTTWYPWNGTTWGSGQGDPRTVTFGIKVVGNTFTDLSGNVLQLQGENASGLELYSSNGNGDWAGFNATTQATWASIKSAWQMNVIRLPLDQYSWTANVSYGGNTYQTIVENTVANIIAAGMLVILDLHHGAPTSYNGYLVGQNIAGFSDGQPGYLSTNAEGFWTSVATVYKNNPAVMFELFNEPYAFDDGSYAYLLNGSGSTNVTFYDQANGQGGGGPTSAQMIVAGHQQLVAAIRATGATNVILYSTTSFNSAMSTSLAVKPTDTLSPQQIGATIHYANGSPANYQTVLNAGVPILMTEFWNPVIGGATSGYPYLQQYHIGYVMWGANNWGGSSNLNTLVSTAPWSSSWGSNGQVAWPLNYRGHAGDGHTQDAVDLGVGNLQAANDDIYAQPLRAGWRR